MLHHAAVDDVLQNLAGDRSERDWSVVRRLLFVSFLVDGNHQRFLPVRWHTSSIQRSLEGDVKTGASSFVPVFSIKAGTESGPVALFGRRF